MAARLQARWLAEFPGVRAYRELALEVLPRLARAQEATDSATAVHTGESALACQRGLSPRDADTTETEHALEHTLASALVKGQRLDEARAVLEAMAPWVDRLEPAARPGIGTRAATLPPPPGSPPRPRSRPLPLADLYEAVGDSARAARLRAAGAGR